MDRQVQGIKDIVLAMLRFLILILLAGVVLEIASIIWVGGALGIVPTLLLMFCGGIAGVWLFRSTGANAAAVLRSSPWNGRGHELLAGTTAVRLLAAVMLLVPGFFSDAVALVLLLLPVKWWAARKSGFAIRAGSPKSRTRQPLGPVIEGEAIEVTRESDLDPPTDNRR
jgi:UPF0716 protein FxsA